MADPTEHDAQVALDGRGAAEARFVGPMVREIHAPLPAPGGEQPPGAEACAVEATAWSGLDRLRAGDPVLHELIAREHRRQAETLTMVAASSIADPAVLGAVVPLGDRDFQLNEGVAASVREEVAALCARFPLPGYAAALFAPAPAVLVAAGTEPVA